MSTNDQPTDARARLRQHFLGDKSLHIKKWDDLYIEDFLPWDKGFVNPAFVDLLHDRKELFPNTEGKRGKALVPGCGKGYDVLLLDEHGYDAYGLESSKNALIAAKEIEKQAKATGQYIGRGDVNWVDGDFFDDGWLIEVQGEKKFDLIYDYTFLSALPPSLRPAWSKRFKDLLAPGGRIVCVEFPTYKPHSTGGPPWALPPKVYMAHLSRPGQELPYAEESGLQESELGDASPDGLQCIAHFQPKRTHNGGYDEQGKITDWVSVWAHPSE
ncbi:thiol methyltransferas-like protein [Amylocarpus encephaloides]|uniref:Thiol methyltransferas-like protein n=1 Tax=Amylocarpus encephaloides TaxID=45428 RepID=A0A9P8C966_9HELO|nr:thiol methyltransferas-like protein [Amylocarpus encephaloides]